MLKSSKKTHEHKDLDKVPNKKEKGTKKSKLDNIRTKESFRDLLTDDTIDLEE